MSSSGITRDYSTGRLDNVTGLISTSGSLTDSYGYQPYGEPNGGSGSDYNLYRYTSTYQDTDTSLYQMGARYYDSKMGRFAQADPLSSSVFTDNRYGYTPGNPVNVVGIANTILGTDDNGK